MLSWQAVVISRFEDQLTCHKTVERFGDLKQRWLQYLQHLIQWRADACLGIS